MPKKKNGGSDKSIELLEKILVVHLHTLGVAQDKIAKIAGRQKAWVNSLLQGLPKVKKSQP